jgi:tryptophan-rich sensory protein
MHTGWGVIPFVLVCELVGVLGAWSTGAGSSDWYRSLAKPAFQPPAWLFGPVWTLLYALMGIAAWRIWRLGADHPGVRLALVLFAVQLALNAAWSPVFFGAQQVGAALVVIVLLWLVLVPTVAAFARLDRPAAGLLLPYLAWVTFAAVLNAAIWKLN